jgi:hypothetical protein
MNILEEAAKVVDGPRQADYGTPIENHKRTADLLTAYLKGKYGFVYVLTPEDVCFLNILQKVSRGINGLTRDTLVDIAGYARNIEIIQDAERRAWKEYPITEFERPVHAARAGDGAHLSSVLPQKADCPVQGGKR